MIVEAARQGNAVYVVRIPAGAGRLVIGWQCPARASALSIRDFRLDFLSGEQPPVSTIGVAYYRTQDIAACLRELIDHYPHYRATAVGFSAKWFAYHNAAGLVDVLAGKSGAEKQESAAVLAGAAV